MRPLLPLRRLLTLVFALLALRLLATAPSVAAQDPPATSRPAPTILDAASLVGSTIRPEAWLVRYGDDPSWAGPELDDASWRAEPVQVVRADEGLPADWQPVGWARWHLRVAEDLVGAPVALRIHHYGAAEIFVDGDLVAEVGVVSAEPDIATPRFHKRPVVVSFDRAGEHVVAVRFSNHRVADYLRIFSSLYLYVELSDPAVAIDRFVGRETLNRQSLGWFCGVFLAFALLHLLLFAFYPAQRANLDFALLCIVLSGLVFFLTYRFIQDDPRIYYRLESWMSWFGLMLGLTSVRFVYRVFYEQWPAHYKALLAIAAGLAVWTPFQPLASVRFVFLFMLVCFAELVRVVILAVVRGKPGARLLGVGAVSLAVGFGIGLLANLGLVPRSTWTSFYLPFLSMGVLLISMSIYLSRRFAAVHRDLEAQLEEVQRLSAEKLEQERRMREEAVERGVLEERYEQKVRELEEARLLQLSMLPKALPDLPELEIAAHMETATEVGGDYYDFALGEDGTLILAIGDATGHGMRAGTMVTAAKSLFNVLASEHQPVDTLSRSTRAMKRMNLRKLAMALTLARYRDGVLRLAAAGMPPALVYRAESGTVEQVLLGGMPLGAMASFPYREETLRLFAGDCVLLMSDGFPERTNADDEMIGYERTIELFTDIGDLPPAEIVDALRRAGDEWADHEPPDDDVTFVAMRIRRVEQEAST